MRPAPSALVAALTLVVTSCTPARTVVVSRKPTETPASPKRIFIVSRLLETGGSPGMGTKFEKMLEARFVANLRRCGVEAGGVALTGFESSRELAKAVKGFAPDAVLRLSPVSVLLAPQGASTLTATFQFALADVSSADPEDEREIWLAKASLFRGDTTFGANGFEHAGEAFVDEVVNKMKTDGFFPGCAPVQPGDLPSSFRKVPREGYTPRSSLRSEGGLTLAALVYPAGRQLEDAMDAEKKASRARGDGEMAGPLKSEPPPGSPTPEKPRGFGLASFVPSLELYATSALAAEFGKMGLATNDARLTLSGRVEDAFVDAEGWGYGALLRIRWELKETSTGKVLFVGEKTASTTPAERSASDVEALAIVLRKSAEALVQDPEFARAIR
jgi:hypothetical protein